MRPSSDLLAWLSVRASLCSLLKDSMQPSLIDWCDSCEAYFMPACNQAAQIKLAEIISADEEVTKVRCTARKPE